MERLRLGRAVEPLGVDGRFASARDAVPNDAVDELGAVADDQPRSAPVGQPVRRRVREQLPRHEADGRSRARRARVDVELHEADDGACAVGAADERLLPVLDAVRVDVGGLHDRQIALGEPGRMEPLGAGAVPLPAVADVERETRAADVARDDLAPVGDVEREHRRPVGAEAERERHVVEAGRCQRALPRAGSRAAAARGTAAPPRASARCATASSRLPQRSGPESTARWIESLYGAVARGGAQEPAATAPAATRHQRRRRPARAPQRATRTCVLFPRTEPIRRTHT